MLAWSVIEFRDLMPPNELRNTLVAIQWANDYLFKTVSQPNRIFVQRLAVVVVVLDSARADGRGRCALRNRPHWDLRRGRRPETFKKATKFYYCVNFEITVHNVAALSCATEYLEMTEKYCNNNLIDRTEDFLSQVALMSLSGAIVVLKSCEDLLPMAEDLKIV
ncbi:hypothetical protein ACFX1R_043028 [Malus domestica]